MLNEITVKAEGNDGPEMRMVVDDRVPVATGPHQLDKVGIVVRYATIADNCTTDEMAE